MMQVYTMIFGRLFKKGALQTTSTGSLMLVNEEKVPYKVDKADAAIWSLCNGITFEELRDSISSKLGWQIPADVLSHLERYVNWCIWAKLIEVRGFTSDQFAELMQQNKSESDTFRKLLLSTQDKIQV
jgi:hypothetical protein